MTIKRSSFHIISSAATIAALSMVGVSAHAACVDASQSGQRSAFQPMAPLYLQAPVIASHAERPNAALRIVGTWHVTYTAGGNPFGEAFIQWHDDGTEWENVNFPVLGGNICMGSWRVVDGNHVSRYHVGWLYTNGNLSGHFTETETDEVARDGNSYHGTNDTQGFDLDGNMIFEVPGTASATRIAAP